MNFDAIRATRIYNEAKVVYVKELNGRSQFLLRCSFNWFIKKLCRMTENICFLRLKSKKMTKNKIKIGKIKEDR